MKTRSSLAPQVAFWGLCLIVVVWIAATILFELHLGWPAAGFQWAKRFVGWSMELLLIRALAIGVRRYHRMPASAG